MGFTFGGGQGAGSISLQSVDKKDCLGGPALCAGLAVVLQVAAETAVKGYFYLL